MNLILIINPFSHQDTVLPAISSSTTSRIQSYHLTPSQISHSHHPQQEQHHQYHPDPSQPQRVTITTSITESIISPQSPLHHHYHHHHDKSMAVSSTSSSSRTAATDLREESSKRSSTPSSSPYHPTVHKKIEPPDPLSGHKA
jgi:hypothetical protein